MIPCRYCDYKAQDYGDLARHISSSKKGHRWGKKWAASYLTKSQVLNQKRNLPTRIPMTEEQKQAVEKAKEETHRKLSGKDSIVSAICPKCKRSHFTAVPVEYTNEARAWRTPEGTLIIMCGACKGK